MHVELPLAPWEAALGATAAVETPDGEAKVRSRRARRAAGGCGCAAAACRTPGARRVTCSPRCGSWCQRSCRPTSGGCSRNSPPCPPSTRGGPSEPARRRRAGATVTYALARPVRLDLESFARATGTHPDLVRRLVTLGVLDAETDQAGQLWFSPGAVRGHGQGAAPPRRVRAELRGPRPRGRPARPDRGTGDGAARQPRTQWRSVVDPNRLTQKSQEALHDAQTKALRFGHTEVDGEHLLLALLDQPDGLVPRLLERAGVDTGPAAGRPGGRACPPSAGQRARRGTRAGRGDPAAVPAAGRRGPGGQQAQGRLRRPSSTCIIALIDEGTASSAGRLLREEGLSKDTFLECPGPDSRQSARHLGHAGGRLRGAGEVRARSGRRRRRGQARPGHRPGRGDPPGGADPVPQDQEQPGPDR